MTIAVVFSLDSLKIAYLYFW